MKTTIENIVVSMDLGTRLDLPHIAASLDRAEYNMQKFPGAVYRTKEPKIAFLIFSSGKANCTGAKNIKDMETTIDMLVDDLTSIGYTTTSKDYTIQNIIAGASINEEIDLDALIISNAFENIEYEPEVFPGLVYRINDPRVFVLIFRSGKFVFTGAKSFEELAVAKENVCNILGGCGYMVVE